MDLQSLDLGPQIDEVISTLAPLARAKELDLSSRLAPRRTPCARRRRWLRQILTNLIGNAIKFTETGMVQVAVEARGEEVAIHVIDTGLGIPEADLDKIFQEFFQVDQTLARRQGGTGLGLAIASRLARLMGGRIAVSSVVGSGSRFTLTLPRAPAEEIAARPRTGATGTPTRPLRAAAEPDQHRPLPTVLLVEDDEDNLFTLRQVLARLPIEIVGPRAAGRPSPGVGPRCPTWSSWTCRCRECRACRPPAPSGRCRAEGPSRSWL